MSIKKVNTEVLLILHLYLIWFFIWWRFRHLIKIMADTGKILNDYNFPRDTVDIAIEGIEQYKKRDYLRSAIIKGKAYLLGGKWTLGNVNKPSDETISKMYTEYMQRDLNEKSEKTGATIGKHVISLFSNGISQLVKIKDAKKLRQDIENDLIIKDQMAGLVCLFVCRFGYVWLRLSFCMYLANVLIATHRANNLDFDHEQGLENEGYESNEKNFFVCLLSRHKRTA